MPGQELGPEATTHHLYLTDVHSEEKRVFLLPDPREAQTQGPGRFHTGRQVNTDAQENSVGSCSLLPKLLPL